MLSGEGPAIPSVVGDNGDAFGSTILVGDGHCRETSFPLTGLHGVGGCIPLLRKNLLSLSFFLQRVRRRLSGLCWFVGVVFFAVLVLLLPPSRARVCVFVLYFWFFSTDIYPTCSCH